MIAESSRVSAIRLSTQIKSVPYTKAKAEVNGYDKKATKAFILFLNNWIFRISGKLPGKAVNKPYRKPTQVNK